MYVIKMTCSQCQCPCNEIIMYFVEDSVTVQVRGGGHKDAGVEQQDVRQEEPAPHGGMVNR